MENSNAQLELFSSDRVIRNTKGNPFGLRISTYFSSHEKTVFLIILFVVNAIIFFTLGVERGKRINPITSSGITQGGINTDSRVIINKPIPTDTPEQDRVIVKKDTTIKEALWQNKQYYAIQLASYKTNVYAQKEADNLKKKGFNAKVIQKGKYSVLYVGPFPDKETAHPVLSELKKRYEGCYITRRL
ncbi:MAG: SPOR domain-containing protein [Candidatus Omnitrophica bacterium]|nr:SPOR domain-containing protein [Candidatus Omnitrophota bacterium]